MSVKAKDLKTPYECIDITYGTGEKTGRAIPLCGYPRPAAPFSLQTSESAYGRCYNRGDPLFRGLRLTHYVSPNINDYGQLIVMPQAGQLNSDISEYGSPYREDEMRPSRMTGYLFRYRVSYEFIPTTYGGYFRFKFDENAEKPHRVLMIAPIEECAFECVGGAVRGYTTAGARYCTVPFKEYIHVTADRPYRFVATDEGCALEFDDDEIEIRLSVSTMSADGAEFLHSHDFASTAEKAEAACRSVWQHLISRIKITATNKKQIKRRERFYTCLYRAFLTPYRMHELTPKQGLLHFDFAGSDGGFERQYTGFDLTAAYRTVFPLYSLIAPDLYEEICTGIAHTYTETEGRLPRQANLEDMFATVGMPIEPILADAIKKNLILNKFTKDTLRNALFNSRRRPTDKDLRYGRSHTDALDCYGYVPYEEAPFSAAETVEQSICDSCSSELAELGKAWTSEERTRGAVAYKNLFDFGCGYLRIRSKRGNFLGEISPFEPDDNYGGVSAAALTLSPLHDIEGVNELLSGKAEQLTDTLLGGKLLGADEEASGACAPSAALRSPYTYHLPYIYALLGNSDKTAKVIEKIADEGFTDEGYPGDERAGALSSWYILACLGLYSASPASGEWIVTPPLLSKTEVNNSAYRFALSPKTELPDRVKHEDIEKLARSK